MRPVRPETGRVAASAAFVLLYTRCSAACPVPPAPYHLLCAALLWLSAHESDPPTTLHSSDPRGTEPSPRCTLHPRADHGSSHGRMWVTAHHSHRLHLACVLAAWC